MVDVVVGEEDIVDVVEVMIWLRCGDVVVVASRCLGLECIY